MMPLDPSEARGPRRLHALEFTEADYRRRSSHNLPLALSTFVGRDREIDEVKRLVGSDRMLTLTGPGGGGKTRLALAVVPEVVEKFEEGAWWVELAPLHEPELVPQAVASALDVREVSGRTLTEELVNNLRARKLLLILDNCEHLIGACAELADTLLRSCPNVRILATSREPLGVAGETHWRVPSLAVPDRAHPPSPEGASRYGAVGLFVERARSRTSTFELTGDNAGAVYEVCRKLEGIPLAIELAAARVPVLSTEQIAERLGNPLNLLSAGDRTADPRQRTLRGTLAWSHDLLSEPERGLFRRLSVFARGWALEAAEAVGDREGDDGNGVLNLLLGLVSKSLVFTEAGEENRLRYRMLEPVRQYGQEHLEASGEASFVRYRHAAWFLELAEAAEPALLGPEQGMWLERLDREHDNFRVALSWALEGDEADLGLRLSGALAEFWYGRGHLSEGRRWLEAALAAGETSELARIKPLIRFAWIAMEQGDCERSAAAGDEGLALSRKHGSEPEVALALFMLGMVKMHLNELDRASTLIEEALALHRASEDTTGIARALPALGLVAAAQHDYERALALHEESLRLARIAQDELMIGFSLGVGALAYLGRGDHEKATVLCEEGLERSLRLGMLTQAADILHVSAALAGSQGQAARSARLWGAAEALREAIGTRLSPVERSHYGPYIDAARSQLSEAAWGAAWTEGRAMTTQEAVEHFLSDAEPPAPQHATTAGSYPAGLSAREAEVLSFVSRGLTNSQIAAELFISPRTVNRHLNSIYRKLGIGSRAAATRFAVEHGLA